MELCASLFLSHFWIVMGNSNLKLIASDWLLTESSSVSGDQKSPVDIGMKHDSNILLNQGLSRLSCWNQSVSMKFDLFWPVFFFFLPTLVSHKIIVIEHGYLHKFSSFLP